MSNTVLIQCVLIREGGTKVSLDETTYHFMDYGDGNHLAPVKNQKHIDTFLKISEGYRRFKGPSGQTSEPVISMGTSVDEPIDWQSRMMATDSQLATASIPPPDPAADEPVAVEPVDPAPNPEAVEPAPDPEHAVLEPQDPSADGKIVALEDMDDSQLRTVYEDEVGRKPHPAAKADTMRGSIQATRDEKTEAA
jgi:hypothetical protein